MSPTASPAAAARPALVVTAATKPARPLPAAPPPPPTWEPEPAPRRGGTGIRVFRIVACQLAVVLVLPAIGRPWPVVVALCTAAAVLLALGTVRVGDRWLSEALAGRAGLLLRRTEHDCGGPEQAPANLLAVLSPGTTIGTADLAGFPTGVLSSPAGLVAVLRPATDTGAFLDAVVTGPWQVVVHAGPDRSAPHRVWVALRARRDVDAFDDDQLTPALANAVRRTVRRLRQLGLPAEPLSHDDLRNTVVALTHTAHGRGAVREQWRFWRSGTVTQAGFRLTGLDRLRAHDRVPVLERLLAATPGVAVTLAVAGERAVLRVAGSNGAAVDVAAADLAYLGGRLGVRLERLDGRHAHAVAATLPIGGESL